MTASSLCGACGEVCPVRIPIPDMLQRLRRRPSTTHSRPRTAGGAGGDQEPARDPSPCRGFAFAATHPRLYHAANWVAGRSRGWMPKHLGPWTQCREPPNPPQSLHALRQKKKESPEMSSKEAILASRRRRHAPIAHAPMAGSPGAGG